MGQQPGTPVDLCNLALDSIGQAPITSILAPGTPTEDICARWYDEIRREVLRDFIFNFARKPAMLQSGTPPVVHPDYATAFMLPSDNIRLLTIGDRRLYGGNTPTDFFDVALGWLYTDGNIGSAQTLSPQGFALTAVYRSGETYLGVQVPAGTTVVLLTGATPVYGIQYTLNNVLGTVQLNGNTYLVKAGLLGANPVFFLQTTAGQNFDSSAYGAYISGGGVTVAYVPPAISTTTQTGLQIEYIYDAVLVGQFDPSFNKVLYYRLAEAMSPKFRVPEKTLDRLARWLEKAELKASAISGQEKPPRRVQRSRVRDVRRSGGIYRNNTVIG